MQTKQRKKIKKKKKTLGYWSIFVLASVSVTALPSNPTKK